MIGFETIGNATLTAFDGVPILTTDPWIKGNPQFGSWSHVYDIPKQQLDNIKITIKKDICDISKHSLSVILLNTRFNSSC